MCINLIQTSCHLSQSLRTLADQVRKRERLKKQMAALWSHNIRQQVRQLVSVLLVLEKPITPARSAILDDKSEILL